MSSNIIFNTHMTSNNIQIPKIAQNTMLGIRSPPQHMLHNKQIVYTHSRKNSKDFLMNTIHEET
jgi:hypothetical protein